MIDFLSTPQSSSSSSSSLFHRRTDRQGLMHHPPSSHRPSQYYRTAITPVDGRERGGGGGYVSNEGTGKDVASSGGGARWMISLARLLLISSSTLPSRMSPHDPSHSANIPFDNTLPTPYTKSHSYPPPTPYQIPYRHLTHSFVKTTTLSLLPAAMQW